MSWAVGYDENWGRDVGYGVPAKCDYPDCPEKIDRGLGYICGDQPFGGDDGCGLFFCESHMLIEVDEHGHLTGPQRCDRCIEGGATYDPKPDLPEWIRHKLTDPSWQQWRDENPDEVKALKGQRG